MVNSRREGGVDLPACIRRRRAVANREPEINPPLDPTPAGTDVVVTTQMQQLRKWPKLWQNCKLSSTKTGDSLHLHHHQLHAGISIVNS